MPQQIPILYTGLNVARPDFKSMTKDIKTSFAQARQRKQQQAQFKSLQNERKTKEFMKNLDVEAMNSNNESIMNEYSRIVDEGTQRVTDMLKESGGEVTDEIQIQGRLGFLEDSQKIKDLKQQANNWKIDMKTFADNPNIYDHDRADELINWKWSKDTPYESILGKLYKQRSVDENRAMHHAKMRDPDTWRTTGIIAGKDTPTDESYDAWYYNKKVDRQGNEYLTSNYPNQVAFLKAAMSEQGEESVITQQTYDRAYQKAIADNPKLKELYEQKAINSTGNKDDVEYIYELDQAEADGASYFPRGQGKVIKEDKTNEPKITTTRGVKKSDGRIVLNDINESTVEYQDGTSTENYVSFGNGSVKNVEAVINDPIDKSTGNKLGKTLSASDFNNADFIGVDYSEEEPMLHFKVNFGTQNKQSKEGDDIYVYGRYPEGTQNQIEEAIREKYVENIKSNASAWRKRKDIKLSDVEIQELDKKLNRFRDKVDEGDLIPVTEKKIKDVLAPASSNDAYSKLYINKSNISRKSKEEPQELTQDEWNTKWSNLKSGEKLTGLDGVEYTKK